LIEYRKNAVTVAAGHVDRVDVVLPLICCRIVVIGEQSSLFEEVLVSGEWCFSVDLPFVGVVVFNVVEVYWTTFAWWAECVLHAGEAVFDVVIEWYVVWFDIVGEEVFEHRVKVDSGSAIFGCDVPDFVAVEVLVKCVFECSLVSGDVCIVGSGGSGLVVIRADEFEVCETAKYIREPVEGVDEVIHVVER
jgi:hypothetical protein